MATLRTWAETRLAPDFARRRDAAARLNTVLSEAFASWTTFLGQERSENNPVNVMRRKINKAAE